MLDMEIAFGIPEETSRIAHAAFPKGNLYMRMRDELGVLYTDPEFANLFPLRGQPAEAPWRLATVTIFQFVEGLSDRQATEAVRARIDWKYAMGLEIEDPGFDSSVLCEFRTRLLKGGAEAHLFDKMLALLKERQLLKVRGRQRTDATHIQAAVRSLNRLECLGETLRCALNRLAEADPHWMAAHTDPEWFDRYSTRIESYRLPQGKDKREAYALVMGADGIRLLAALAEPATPEALKDLPAVQVVRAVWRQHFYFENEQLCLRTEENMPPCALRITSPFDLEARFSTKRETNWIGYKAHLTETCDQDSPHLITQVQTTPSTTYDGHALPDIQAELAQKDRLPSEQLVDEGYTEAAHLVSSQQLYHIQLMGPVAGDCSRQARKKRGYDVTCFEIDWENACVRCPAGKTSLPMTRVNLPNATIRLQAAFSRATCRACPHRADCTGCQTRGRVMYLHVKDEHEALQAARLRQQTTQFRKRYAARAGIEGTLSEAVRAYGLRRSRYIGQAKTHLQHLMIASAMNFCRVFEWLSGTPFAKTRQSHFACLKPKLATA
jgi:transposase